MISHLYDPNFKGLSWFQIEDQVNPRQNGVEPPAYRQPTEVVQQQPPQPGQVLECSPTNITRAVLIGLESIEDLK